MSSVLVRSRLSTRWSGKMKNKILFTGQLVFEHDEFRASDFRKVIEGIQKQGFTISEVNMLPDRVSIKYVRTIDRWF
jgi:hypothetical protein